MSQTLHHPSPNDGYPLCDSTGSRCYLCLRVPDGEFIDNSSVINYDQLYAQMMYELRDKQTPYWFTNDEVSRIQESLGAVFLEKVKGG